MAVTLDAAALATAADMDTDEATRLLAVVSLLVEGYAGSAPSSVQNEACIRTAAYLSSSQGGLAASQMSIGNGQETRFRAAGSALRLSGSESLLSFWRKPRARAV